MRLIVGILAFANVWWQWHNFKKAQEENRIAHGGA